MNRLLIRDDELFQTEFQGAVDFLRGAHLRYDLFTLFLDKHRTEQQQKHLEDLQTCPACREDWFIDKLLRENLIERDWRDSIKAFGEE